jgi:tetratricopeptide (TPR) repeat protein/predicted Ser/Thr protein kinase
MTTRLHGCRASSTEPAIGSPPSDHESARVIDDEQGDRMLPDLFEVTQRKVAGRRPGPLAETLDASSGLGTETIGHDGKARAAHPSLQRRLGRFQVRGVLGRGGMGIVLEALDETLARTVALKLLHGRVDESRKDRLLREAQALAQLSHPNVVQVYEVGMVEDQMFIAMELVEGETLREWQRRRRPWRQVVEVYRQAGRGLAAAHARDLIHRDFKPENCIISEDGRVRVLDFGLARGSKPGEPTEPTEPQDLRMEDGALRQRMTQSGKVLGTLSYLPLAQLMGRPADTKSDQFSFCVSLYEALYGVLPFHDASVLALISALEAGVLQTGPHDRAVPRRLRRILLRGLAQQPEARWATMEELLAALERLLHPSRWRYQATVATLLVGFGAGAALFALAQEAPCTDSRAALEGTWNRADRQTVEAAFLGSGHAEAPQLLERVKAELDAYAEAWVDMHEESCRATYVHQSQSEALLDRRMRCLQRRHGRLRVTIDALAEVSSPSEALERTVLPFKLPRLESCADLDALEAALPLPDEPEQRERVVALRREIDRADTLGEGGAIGEATRIAFAAVEAARSVEHEPVLAEALEALGRLQVMGGSATAGEVTLQEAIEVAARAKDDASGARAWSSLVYAVMVQDELDRGLSLRFAARAAVERANDPVARGWLLNNLGSLHGQRGELDEAHDLFQRALEVKESALGPDHLDVGIAWSNLGNALAGGDHPDEAREAFERARAIFVAKVGESHPYVAFVETGLGDLGEERGELALAAEHHQHALEIRERSLGPHHVQVAKSLEHLGSVRQRQGELDDAVELLRRALDVYVVVLGPEGAQVGVSALVLAEAERARGHLQDARTLAARAQRLLDTHGKPSERVQARFMRARVLQDQPREHAQARALAEQALAELDGDERAEVEAWLERYPALPP